MITMMKLKSRKKTNVSMRSLYVDVCFEKSKDRPRVLYKSIIREKPSSVRHRLRSSSGPGRRDHDISRVPGPHGAHATRPDDRWIDLASQCVALRGIACRSGLKATTREHDTRSYRRYGFTPCLPMPYHSTVSDCVAHVSNRVFVRLRFPVHCL